MSISTHVLDAVSGRPAVGVPVRLERSQGDAWTVVAERITNDDGRIADLAGDVAAGIYRATFETEAYFSATPTFYPQVVIVFRVVDSQAHHHVPLLLSPFSYSTYRGS
jgi:5-hydroxyisourate hydrolase